ncbi:MAG: reverse transcriptase-like protein, partial [Candidatus Thiodiazotropha endolucinida]|nr:reverse transcriptase-like protein [Candidatus Thiodiazotropha endolucinida]
KNRSTLDQILRLQTEILKAKAEHRELLCIFLDLEKAFDLMWTNGVLLQLVNFNIKGKLLTWTQDFLKDRKLQVRVGTEHSETKMTENGSPQGSVLSPILFNILMNTQHDALKGVTNDLSQYADDSAIWKTGKSRTNLVRISQKILDIIHEWAKTWGFKISADKTESVVFNYQYKPNETVKKLKLGDREIQFKTESKFLGMTFDNKLTWEKHITNIVQRCKKDLNLMRYISGTKYGADKITLRKIYTTLIRSKIDYGCQAYSSASKAQLERLDRIQAAALRIITGAYKSSANVDVQIECNMPPLKLRRDELILKYWARSSVLKDKLPINKLYDHVVYEAYEHRLGYKIPYVRKVEALKEEFGLKNLEIQGATYQEKFNLKSIEPRDTLRKYINKKTDNKKKIEEITKRYIKQNYQADLQIFTDGSKNKATDTVGCAFVIPSYRYSEKLKLNKDISIFSAELTAIIKALTWIRDNKPENVVILTDSLSAIQAMKGLDSKSRPDMIMEINNLIDEILVHKIILNIDWCPSHCNVSGNEMADEAAGAGAQHGKPHNISLAKTEVYALIKNKIKTKWAENWKNHHGFRWELDNRLPTKVIQYSDNRQMDRAYTRLRLGRNGLAFHNQTYGEMDPLCPHCGDIEDAEHYLLRCDKHNIHRNEMISQIKQLSEQGTQDVTLKLLLDPPQKIATKIRDIVTNFIIKTEYATII